MSGSVILRAYHSIRGYINVVIDGVSNALVMIDYPHSEGHNKSRFFITDALAVDDGEDREIRFQTPNTDKHAHFTLNIEATGETDVFLFKETTTTHVIGNVLTPVNRNQNSPPASVMTICHTPGGSGDGSQLAKVMFGLDTGQGGNRILTGGEAGGRAEIVLAKNTAYLIRVASGTDGNRLTTILDWYEHTDKNI